MGDDNNSDFAYHPNHAAAILFAVLFGLTLIAHSVQAARARALFMLTLVIATSMELIGYIMRYAQPCREFRTRALMVIFTDILR